MHFSLYTEKEVAAPGGKKGKGKTMDTSAAGTIQTTTVAPKPRGRPKKTNTTETGGASSSQVAPVKPPPRKRGATQLSQVETMPPKRQTRSGLLSQP